MPIGIKDIAERLGLSANTVSNILNRGLAEKYSAATRAKVVQAAEKLGYRPDRAAQSMRSGKSRMIAFAAMNATRGGQLENYVIHPFLAGLSAGLIKRGYHLSLVELSELHDGDALELPPILKERFFDGLVVHYGAPDRLAEWAERTRMPVLWWDCRPGEAHGALHRDEAEAARELTRRLLALGHRRIAFLAGGSWEAYLRDPMAVHFSYRDRYRAYAAELGKAGQAPIPLVGYDPASLAATLRRESVTAVLTLRTPPPEALFLAAQRAGLVIPDSLSLASFDVEARLPVRGFCVGGITHDRFEKGERAAALILEQVQSPRKKIPSSTYTGTYLEGDSIRKPL